MLMSSHSVPQPKAPFAERLAARAQSNAPFHTDRDQATYQNQHLLSWHGANLFISTYEPTASVRLWSRTSIDGISILLQGMVQKHEGEINGNVFRFGSHRRRQISVFPCAARMDFHMAHSRLKACDLLFPQRFARDQLGFREERQLTLQLARPDPFLFHTAEQFVALVNLHDDVSALQKDSLFRVLALHLFANYCEGPALQLPANLHQLSTARTRQLRDYIDSELHRRFSVGELALLAGCESREFHTIFRNTFGNSPAQYIIERRLERASQLIRNTMLDITDIALDTGFSSQSHLTTTLRKRRGVTPYQLRRRSVHAFLLQREPHRISAR